LAIKSKQRAQQNQKMGEVDRIEIEEDWWFIDFRESWMKHKTQIDDDANSRIID
jgi:hypothetical protein